jgi:hypothetical protein
MKTFCAEIFSCKVNRLPCTKPHVNLLLSKSVIRLLPWLLITSAALATGPSPTPSVSPSMPTWQNEIAQGHLPYHQLTVDDFPIDDHAHPKFGFWIKPFIYPRWHYYWKSHRGFVYAFIDQWVVFSGIDKNESSRKSTYHEMTTALPYVQAELDINELKARELAALKPGELPQGRGESVEKAKADLEAKIKVLCLEKYRQAQDEVEALAKATHNGEDKSKVRELAAAIQKRLAATASSSVSPTESSTATAGAIAATPTASPTPAKP